MNVLKPHLQTTIWTLLSAGASQREIERVTGIDRKTKLHHAAADAVHEVEAALASLQDSINAATADIGSIKNPRQRTAAENRLAQRMEQKRRLEVQLWQGKVRALHLVGDRAEVTCPGCPRWPGRFRTLRQL